MVTHYGNSACEGSSPYQLKMAAPAEVSKKRSNFRIRQFYEKRHFNIAANLTLNTMVSFIILLIARTARIACPDRQTERQNDRQNDKPSTVTLAAHARRGLITGDHEQSKLFGSRPVNSHGMTVSHNFKPRFMFTWQLTISVPLTV